VEPHPEPGPYLRVLTRGYSGRLLRLYALAQRFARPDRPPQPAYLVLSNHQGGFPRYGFDLDGPRPDTAYVDLHRSGDVTGRAGAMDKIFPHELLHIIVFDLAGEAPEGQASQVHAIGVRTDRVTAFNEGFAEHGQLMAVDDPDGLPETRALATDAEARDRAYARMAAYRRAIAARWSVAPKARMTFPLWFSGSEQVLRYHAVRDNRFAHEAEVPARLYTNRHAYRAYLLENVLPGETGAASKSVARQLATEGVVSALFYRLVNDATVQRADAPSATYARFGVERSALAPVENAYLKVFSAIEVGKFDAADVVAAYQRLYPAERDAVNRLLTDTLGQGLSEHTPIWLLNGEFKTGTTLFDQERNLPRSHTFDLNAASMADLVGVPGIDAPLARALVSAAPFASIDDTARVPGMTPAVVDRLRAMKAAMDAPPDPGTSHEGGLSIQGLLLPYVWRALIVWAVCAVVAGALYRAVRDVRWWRVALAGLAAALAGLVAGWTIDPGYGLLALAAPVAAFGLPGAVIRLWRTRSFREAGMVAAAWALAALPSALAVTPIG
jgi:DNA uptake protein ComE-like DNA-binding protein